MKLIITATAVIKAESHQIELDEAVRTVDELTPLIGTITSDTMRKRLTEQLSALDNRIAALERLPASESRWDVRETEETYGEAWDRADTDARRQLLLRSGITAAVSYVDKSLRFDLRIPEDVLERVSR